MHIHLLFFIGCTILLIYLASPSSSAPTTKRLPGKKPTTATRSNVDPGLFKKAVQLVTVQFSAAEFNATVQGKLDNDTSIPPSVRQVVYDAIMKILPYDTIRDEGARFYAKHYNANEMQQLIKFHATPLGKKYVRLEDELEKHLDSYVNQTLTKRLPEYLAETFGTA
ncbi:unnamed protein product [Didymodactylos carnosus]|uniref:DUF2059 domain-containing protein n=1 Tax=Didymodactylos carnosus TaxID=1234261 RepID=A0A8S2E4Z7_9BILA|nr:unnamed protein product [Didymodactylos carnosus]CAF3850509.1 unnamed protein product [Didymodactylos carnosus]